MESRPSLAFVGAGKVATALSLRWQAAGYPITGVASRQRGSAEQLAALLECPVVAVPRADIIFLTVPDDVLVEIAPIWAGKKLASALVHTSGVHSLDVFGDIEPQAVGSFHPMYPFRQGTRLTGETSFLVGIEASTPVLQTQLRELAQHLPASPAILVAGSKARYHSAAVIASNYLVVLFAASLDLLQSVGVPHPLAQQALNQLMQGNVDNLRELLPAQALTGPIARGDLATIEQHLTALQSTPYADLYRTLALQAVEIAPALSVDVRQKLMTLLRGSK